LKAGIVIPINGGIINATASLAQVNRALMCASLSDMETYIECNEMPEDIFTTINSLKGQGAQIRYDGSGFEVVPLNISESERGFAAAAAGHGFAGQNNRGEYHLQGDTAYRTINGLLFTLPIQSGDSKIIVTGKEECSANIRMTIDTLDMFNIKVERCVTDDGGATYLVAGGQRYKTPGIVKTEGDWTNSAFWLCAAAAYGSGVICENLSRSSRQADKEVMSILERFGAITAYKGDSVAVRRSRLRSIRIDIAETPDIVSALALVAAVAEGQTVIYNAQRVGLDKNETLSKINKALTTIGADIVENSDGLVIRGKPKLRGGTVSSFGDSRIVMMLAVAAGVCEDIVAINDADAVRKTYPDFFDDYEKLGGQVMRK